MAKFDEQLSRMEFLMGYNMPKNTTPSKIEYVTEGADGKMYGILKEGTKYYIMTAEKGKEMLAESFEYIGGFDHRNENGFNSYNKATKILEEKMIVLNEEYGIHKDVSTVDFKRNEKILENLTKEARTELDRVKMIMENSVKVGAPVIGKGAGEGKPFDEKAEAKLDKDLKTEATTPEKANEDYTDASKVVEKELTTGEPKGVGKSADECEKANPDLDGVAVAAEEPKGGKATMVNEDIYHDEEAMVDTPDENLELDEIPDEFYQDAVEDEQNAVDDALVGFSDGSEAEPDNAPEVEDELDDLDALMEEFKECISGDEETLTGPHGSLEVQTVECTEGECAKTEEKQEALDGPKGNGEAIAMERLKESIDRITNEVTNKLFESKKHKKVTLEEAIKNVLKETELHVWGDHPRYQEQPMTTPPNTDVKKGTADKDWNDSSAEGSEPYGKKIGDGKPFDQVVSVLTDSVMAILKETLSVKKK